MNAYQTDGLGNHNDDGGDSTGSSGNFLNQLPATFWQRRWCVIVPFLIGLIGAVIACVVLPPVYRSSALILVQSPQLPDSFTGGDTSELVERRMARIRAQVTSRPDLIALIQKHSLYRSKLNSKPLSEIVDDMREDINVTPTVADLPAARQDQRTIAFELAYDYSEPEKAQAVAQDLLDRILELDSTSNATKATNMVQFLTDQATGLEKQIAGLQGQIADITARNGGILSRAGVAVMGGGSAGYDMQIAQLERDISSLTAQRSAGSGKRDPAVVSAESQLAAARAIYSENHPDVVIAKQRLAQAQEFARSTKAEMGGDPIDQQIAANRAQIAALRAAKMQDQGQVTAAMQAQSRAPAVQNQIADLQSQLSALTEQYNTISDRLATAKAAVRAGDQQMGERLNVVDPPVVPDEAEEPKAWLILLLGAAGGLAFGLLLALAVEIVISPVRDPLRLAAITGELPLGTIPMINDRDKEYVRSHGFWARLAFWNRRKLPARKGRQDDDGESGHGFT